MGLFDSIDLSQLGALNGAFAPPPDQQVPGALQQQPQQPQQPTFDISSLFTPQAVKEPNVLQKIGAVLADTSAGLRGDLGDKGHPSAVTGLMAPTQAAKAGGAGLATPQLAQAAKALFPNDPKAQFLMATGNKDFLGAIADAYKTHTINGGDSVINPDGSFKTAPKLVESGGIYGTQTGDGYSQTGARGPSIAETQTAQQNDPTTPGGQAWARVQENLRGMGALNETGRHNRAEEGVGYGNLNLRGQEFQASQVGVGAQQSGKSGDEFLADLDPGTASTVKALAEGRLALPSAGRLNQRQQQLLSLVAQYDPSFDAANYGARAATRKDLATGKMGQNVTSLNTVIGHLGELADATDKLGNSGIPLLNQAGNTFAVAIGNKGKQTAVSNFNAAKTAAIDELTKAFRGTGGSVHDIEEWEKQINSSNSPDQLHATIKQGVHLLQSRIDAVGDQYNRGMGVTSDPVQLLTPKARSTLARLQGGAAPTSAAPASSGWKVIP